jgi:hypothetical protein
MAKQTINIGAAPNDGTGTPLRTSFDYCNQNFTELYTATGPSGNNIVVPGSATISGDLTVRTNQLVVNSNGVGVGTTPSAWSGIGPAIQVEQASLLSEASNQLYLTANGYFAGGQWNYINNASADQYYQISGSHVWRNGTGGAGGTAIGWSTLMTLNSTGLGVGVSPTVGFELQQTSPMARITSTSTTGYSTLTLRNTGASGRTYGITVGGSGTGATAAGNLYISDDTASAIRLTLDSSGNVGVGVTPSAWTSSDRALQFAYGNSIATATSTNFSIARNAQELAGGWTYSANGFSQLYNLESDGGYKWYTAISGTAGNLVSYGSAKMTLDTLGNLILLSPSTPPTLATNGQLTVNATSNTNLRFSYRGSDGTTRVANITLA